MPRNKVSKRAYDAAYRQENLVKRRRQARDWYANNKKRKQQYDRQRRRIKNARRRASYARDPSTIKASNKRSHRRRQLRQYGLTEAQFAALFRAQGNACACCGRTTNKGNKSWCVDHDHQTGEVRGILCGLCNTGIGALGDNLEGLKKAVKYLRRHYHPKTRRTRTVLGARQRNDDDDAAREAA